MSFVKTVAPLKKKEKKNPAPTREEDGHTILAASDSRIYFYLASLSGLEMLSS